MAESIVHFVGKKISAREVAAETELPFNLNWWKHDDVKAFYYRRFFLRFSNLLFIAFMSILTFTFIDLLLMFKFYGEPLTCHFFYKFIIIIIYHSFSSAEGSVLARRMAPVIIHQKGVVEAAVPKTSFPIWDLKVYHMEGELLGEEAEAVVDMWGEGEGEGEEDSDSFVSAINVT